MHNMAHSGPHSALHALRTLPPHVIVFSSSKFKGAGFAFTDKYSQALQKGRFCFHRINFHIFFFFFFWKHVKELMHTCRKKLPVLIFYSLQSFAFHNDISFSPANRGKKRET